jgi:hypothetical protein
MAKDIRLDLGRYITNPFHKGSYDQRKLSFSDSFRTPSRSNKTPWTPSRFTEEDLLNRVKTKQLNLNPNLNFVSNAPFFDDNTEVTKDYELFKGLGRFKRREDYDFTEGRAKTAQRPQDQPDYQPLWMEAYKLSPTLNPEKHAKNPMPTMSNPDPRGFLMAIAENRAKDEAEGNMSVSELLPSKQTSANVRKEQQAGKETTLEENKLPLEPGQK